MQLNTIVVAIVQIMQSNVPGRQGFGSMDVSLPKIANAQKSYPNNEYFHEGLKERQCGR